MRTARLFFCLVLLLSFSSGAQPQTAPPVPVQLTAVDVAAIIEAAVRADSSNDYFVVVVDRAGRILGAWQKPNASLESAEWALSLARTGAFFSNNQAPLSSRTVRYISGIHFPPGIPFQPPAPLYGIESSNRGCSFDTEYNPGQSIPPALSFESFLRSEGIEPGDPLVCNAFDQSGCSVGVVTGKLTGTFAGGNLTGIPSAELLDQKPLQVYGGGIPIFENCQVVGGIGVYGNAPDAAEYAALVGSLAGGPSFGPLACLPAPGAIFLNGIRLPFVQQATRPADSSPGMLAGGYVVSPGDGAPVPEGWLVGGPDQPNGSADLTADDVQTIVGDAIASAAHARAALRLPIGSRTSMTIAVSDLSGNLLGLYRMPDSTVFSIDIAVAKSRNVVYFSNQPDPSDLPGVRAGTAVSNRTVGFMSQPLYAPGVNGTAPGPAFDLFLRDLAHPCSQGLDNSHPPNQNGVVFFPGSLPLYKDGRLAGGIGVSGDGVDQDDLVAAAGATGFEAPQSIQANNIFVRGVRLPYLSFPYNPYQ